MNLHWCVSSVLSCATSCVVIQEVQMKCLSNCCDNRFLSWCCKWTFPCFECCKDECTAGLTKGHTKKPMFVTESVKTTTMKCDIVCNWINQTKKWSSQLKSEFIFVESNRCIQSTLSEWFWHGKDWNTSTLNFLFLQSAWTFPEPPIGCKLHLINSEAITRALHHSSIAARRVTLLLWYCKLSNQEGRQADWAKAIYS